MASCSSPAKKAKGESTTKPNWLDLPTDVTANILHRLGAAEILMSVRNVCPLWWNICKDPLMWRTIDMMSDFNIFRFGSYRYLVRICQYAINLSCGRLEEINIYHFGTDELLHYIADRASHLRCMRLDGCSAVSDKGLIEVAKKLPPLEELYISTSFLCKDSLEAIGQCCPLLKSLVYSGPAWNSYLEYDDEAFAIAKTMPGLRHLDISGCPLTNVGLLAILDGCPHLESLDLRDCPHLGLSGSLGKRCREQIKDLELLTYYSDPYYQVDWEMELELLAYDSGLDYRVYDWEMDSENEYEYRYAYWDDCI